MCNDCCSNCFSESEIKQFIKDKEIKGDCDYCNSANVYICDVSKASRFIIEGFKRYYEDAANHVSYCSADGGYQIPTDSISDILLYQEEIFGENLNNPYRLCMDLVTNGATPYVRQDPYGPPAGEPDEITFWERFCEITKTQKRFTLFLPSENENAYDCGLPQNFLPRLTYEFLPYLIEPLNKGTKIYRARINNKNRKFTHKDLTSPPAENSGNNRMSPAGISFFYGGMTPEVCIHEVRPDISEYVTIAEFELIQDVSILNLAIEFEERKSIFNPDYNFNYEEYLKPFLEYFVKDISKPIRKTDNEIEYIPTQVFTEFIKSINFKEQYDGKNDVFIDGIQFHSSIMKEGVNLVLFRGTDISTSDRDAWLYYRGKQTYHVTEIIVKSKTNNCHNLVGYDDTGCPAV
jgi:hypothetical protein